MKNSARNNKRITTLTWVVIFALWYFVTKFNLVSATLFPSPLTVWESFVDILNNGYNRISLWSHLGASFYRLFSALFFAIITAIPLGLLSGYFYRIRAVVDSIIEFIRPLPPLAYYTLLILWFGIDNTSKIILLFIAAFSPIYIACVSAVGNIPQDYILSAESLGANKRDVFFKIVLYATLPEIFVGIRTAVGVAYTTLVSAEMIAATSGIGWMVLDASNYVKSDVIFVGIIIMGITGIIINQMLKLIEEKIVFWKGNS